MTEPTRTSVLKSARRKLQSLFPRLAVQRERDRGLPAPIVPDPDRSGIALVAIVRNEERYVGEWLDYHMLVGARHVCVYDNGCTDRTVDILRQSRWAEHITVVPWRNFDAAIRIQNAAYNHALANFGSHYRWMGFIDVDEFIVPKKFDNLDEALVDFRDIAALSLPWHMFGPSGHDTQPAGLVVESYLERAEFPPRPDVVSLLNYKTIVDPAKVRKVKTHHVELFGEADVMWNDRKEKFRYHDRFDPRHATADALQLNHYFTRSREEMRAKIAKGRVSKDGRTKNSDLLEEQVVKLLKYTVRDETILRFVPALKEVMSS